MPVMTIQLTFTPEIQAALNYERYHHPMPLVHRRMEVLWLRAYPNNPAARKAIKAQAKCRNAM